MVKPVAPGAVVGNVQVVAPLLRLEVCAAIRFDPVAMLALSPHKRTLAFLVLACNIGHRVYYQASRLINAERCSLCFSFLFLFSLPATNQCIDSGCQTPDACTTHIPTTEKTDPCTSFL